MGKVKHAAVWLVRSGPTVWEDEGRLVGSAHIPLSAAGQQAARERAHLVRGQALSGLICAPDEASVETAQYIAAVSGEKVKAIEGLADPALGLWEGMREADLEDRWPTVYRQWRDDPFAVKVPNGEIMDEAKDRMIEVLRKLVTKYATSNGTLAVVLRPTALGMARCYFQGLPTTQLWAAATEGDGIHRLTLDCDRLRERLGLACVEPPPDLIEAKAPKARPAPARAGRRTP